MFINTLFKKAMFSLILFGSLISIQSFATKWDAYVSVYFDKNVPKSDRQLFTANKSNIEPTMGKLKGKHYGEITNDPMRLNYESETIHIVAEGDYDNTENAKNYFLDHLMKDAAKSKRAFERSGGDGEIHSGNKEPKKLDFVFPIQIFPLGYEYSPINILIGQGQYKKINDLYFGLSNSNLISVISGINLSGKNNSDMYFFYSSLSSDKKTRKNLLLKLETYYGYYNRIILYVYKQE